MRLWLIAVEYDRLPRVFASCILAFPVFGVLTCQWFSFHLVMSNTDPYSWQLGDLEGLGTDLGKSALDQACLVGTNKTCISFMLGLTQIPTD